MSNSYIPAEDGAMLEWMENFAALIAADNAKYQLSSADSLAISAVVAAYGTAYAAAKSPATRTPATVATKDDNRNLALQLCRQYAILIKFNAGILDSDKIAIGVRPVNPSRQPINVPASSPLLNIVGATPGSQTLRFVDSMNPDKRAKPFGAANIQVFVAVADAEVASPDAAQFYGAFTQGPVGVAFDPADDGKVATYFARWASRKGAVGPWSFPVSMRIAA